MAGGATRKGWGRDGGQLEVGAKGQRRVRGQRVTDGEQAGAASGALVTLLDVWMFSSRLTEQLQQLCGICRCVPLANTLGPHVGMPPPTPLNPSAGLGTGPAAGPGACRREACGRLHVGSGLLSCWHMQQQLRVLGLGPCLWELQGFPSGDQLLDLLYQGKYSMPRGHWLKFRAHIPCPMLAVARSQSTIALPALGEYHGAVPVSHVPLSEHQALLSLLLQLRGTSTTCDVGEGVAGVKEARARHAAALPPGEWTSGFVSRNAG